MFLFFLEFFSSTVLDNNCHKEKWCVLFFAHIKLVAYVLVCSHAIVCIKWRRLPLPVFCVRKSLESLDDWHKETIKRFCSFVTNHLSV